MPSPLEMMEMLFVCSQVNKIVDAIVLRRSTVTGEASLQMARNRNASNTEHYRRKRINSKHTIGNVSAVSSLVDGCRPQLCLVQLHRVVRRFGLNRSIVYER